MGEKSTFRRQVVNDVEMLVRLYKNYPSVNNSKDAVLKTILDKLTSGETGNTSPTGNGLFLSKNAVNSKFSF